MSPLLLQLASGVRSYQAVSVETAVSFLLVLCVVTAARPESAFRQLGPVAVCLSVVLGHLVWPRVAPQKSYFNKSASARFSFSLIFTLKKIFFSY